MPESQRSRKVTRALLRNFPLPDPGARGDKESRGRVLVIGGEVALPGAVILAAIASLRAGAGKLQIATCKSIAVQVGVAVPEAMSLGLRETKDGTIDPRSWTDLKVFASDADAVVIGPGMTIRKTNTQLARDVLRSTQSAVVVDAGALPVLNASPNVLKHRQGNTVVTPNESETAALLDISEGEVEASAPDVALELASRFNAVIALKGPTTVIATPDNRLFRYSGGDVGLGTSGSGDALAGLTAGLLARGAPPLEAALWSVYLHGAAGNRLTRKFGRIGYLARELLAEIPALLEA
ncbi:MAG: NAD(P)H-hydrate dehydratase [Gemmatimonadota bacterium]|nr:NAD(P)H-hydrate dehydratase [Gemmatimonadota bacterium]